jgi:hypothetical protein
LTTLADLADRCQITLSDSAAGTWSQNTVEEWVVDGIRDYSQRFPRTDTISITFSGASPGHQFDVSTDVIALVLVEYPGDQDPPVYLKRRPRTHSQFYGYEGYYDYLVTNDATEYCVLYLSEEPSDGEKAYITYLCHHDVTLLSGDDITVPVTHEGIIELYVIWQAFKERLSAEMQDPDKSLAGNVTLLQQLVKGARQAEEEYRRALQRAQESRSQGGITGPWTVDDDDRIY